MREPVSVRAVAMVAIRLLRCAMIEETLRALQGV
jgi:hypothetical protein